MKKMNKKGVGLTTRKLIGLVLLAILIVVVIVSLVGLDVHGFFRGLPDFFRDWGKGIEDLTEDAVIYGIPVKILLNDGDGRCIVFETKKQDEWLKDYGTRKWKLNIKNLVWHEVNTRIDRITQEMIEDKTVPEDLIEKEKELVNEINGALSVPGKLLPPGKLAIGRLAEGDISGLKLLAEGRVIVNKNYKTNPNELDPANAMGLREFAEDYISENDLRLKLICDGDYNDKQERQRIYIDGREICVLQSTENENHVFAAGKLFVPTYPSIGVFDISWKKWDKNDFKNQRIRQDLIDECYLGERDFKNTAVLGKGVKLLLKDEEERCIIYESNDDFSLEHFGVKKSRLLRIWRLNWLNDKGVWQDIDDKLPGVNKIEEINLARDLIKEEKEFTSYVSEFEYRIEPYATSIKVPIEEIREGDISGFYTLVEFNARITFFKKDSSGNILESYNPQELLLAYNKMEDDKVMIGRTDDYSYLWYPKRNDVRVRDGDIYKSEKVVEGWIWKKEIEKSVEIENEDFNLPQEKWELFLRGAGIKQDLRREC